MILVWGVMRQLWWPCRGKGIIILLFFSFLFHSFLITLIWFDMIWFDLIWFDSISFDFILFDFIWFHLIWFDLLWFDLLWFDVIWFDLIWFDVIWFDLIWFDLIWFDLLRYVGPSVMSILYDTIYLASYIICWMYDNIWFPIVFVLFSSISLFCSYECIIFCTYEGHTFGLFQPSILFPSAKISNCYVFWFTLLPTLFPCLLSILSFVWCWCLPDLCVLHLPSSSCRQSPSFHSFLPLLSSSLPFPF